MSFKHPTSNSVGLSWTKFGTTWVVTRISVWWHFPSQCCKKFW